MKSFLADGHTELLCAGSSYNASGFVPLLQPAASSRLNPTVVLSSPTEVSFANSHLKHDLACQQDLNRVPHDLLLVTVQVSTPVNCPSMQIGACEPFTVDACQSFGTGGRPLLFDFRISSSFLLPPQLLAQLPVNSYQCRFTLDKAALKPSHSYNITATATNFLQLSSSAMVSIYERLYVGLQSETGMCNFEGALPEKILPGSKAEGLLAFLTPCH